MYFCDIRNEPININWMNFTPQSCDIYHWKIICSCGSLTDTVSISYCTSTEWQIAWLVNNELTRSRLWSNDGTTLAPAFAWTPCAPVKTQLSTSWTQLSSFTTIRTCSVEKQHNCFSTLHTLKGNCILNATLNCGRFLFLKDKISQNYWTFWYFRWRMHCQQTHSICSQYLHSVPPTIL
jgi:hypothetical protein